MVEALLLRVVEALLLRGVEALLLRGVVEALLLRGVVEAPCSGSCAHSLEASWFTIATASSTAASPPPRSFARSRMGLTAGFAPLQQEPDLLAALPDHLQVPHCSLCASAAGTAYSAGGPREPVTVGGLRAQAEELARRVAQRVAGGHTPVPDRE